MNQELLSQAQKALNIEKVLLLNLNIKTNINYDPGLDTEPFGVQFRAGPMSERKIIDLDTEQGVMHVSRFYFECGVRLVSNDSTETLTDDDVKYEIIATFAADYVITDKCDPECLDEFGRVNVGYHVWPYWRELVQSSCAKAGISNIPIPMYKVPKNA